MRERGRDFFVMSLARELGMTRRRLLLETDALELSMWQAYFQEVNKPAEKKKQKPEEIACALRNAFAARKHKVKK